MLPSAVNKGSTKDIPNSRDGLNRVQSFPPIVSEQSKLLILGSMPGEASLKAGQYYAHPRNCILAHHGRAVRRRPGVALSGTSGAPSVSRRCPWDSLQACIRPGSLDASITEEVANDFPALFAKYPNITHVFFNGSKPEKTFRRHALPALSEGCHIFARLPSTSPAHAAMRFEAKVQAWCVVKKVLS